MIINKETLSLIQQAIDIEAQNSYTNVQGKYQKFADFIKKQLYFFYKESDKDAKWLGVIECFEKYDMDSLPGRKNSINTLIKVIKNSNKKDKSLNNNKLKTLKTTDISDIKGIGPKISFLFNKLGIFTAHDLLTYYPKKHINYASRTLIRNLKEGQDATIYGCIKNVSAYTTRSGLGVLKIKIEDESGSLELSFFYQKTSRYLLERYRKQFPSKATIMISGKGKRDKYTGKMTLANPEHQIISADFDENKNLNMGRIVPIYGLTENLSIKTLRRAIFNTINEFKYEIKEVLPQYLIDKYDFISKFDAISQIHFPDNEENIEKARKRLVYEELFLFQLGCALLRKETSNSLKAVKIRTEKEGLVQKFIKDLPFELTTAQKKAILEITNDMKTGKPMQRLLQGDVGSGKTIVACIMLLCAVENGFQGALMAPTEILAQQHFYNFSKWLAPYNIKVGLFIGANKSKLKKQIETDLRNGQIDIAIGTQALLQENIAFNNLGAIVIDEQHRFGVKQRSMLRTKGEMPQVLTMTATPIPRTLSLTIHGDLDLSIIDELPGGRKPIKTALLKAGERNKAYSLIKKEVISGHQIYIVFPLIEESEALSAKAATIEAERLQKEIFPQYKIGLLHGKLKNDEKDKIMNDFKNGLYHILVSTTVVEVGVDVKNATVMVIENAERFGLSQLHQLRGRVGRSDLQSYCILISSTQNDETINRLKIMEQTNNGFIIAEKDLAIRGPGEFLGVRQSGLPDFSIADISKDTTILEQARNDAFELVMTKGLENFPKLQKELNEKKEVNNYLINPA